MKTVGDIIAATRDTASGLLRRTQQVLEALELMAAKNVGAVFGAQR